MADRLLETLGALGLAMLVGSTAVLVSLAIGWAVGAQRSFLPVRLVTWWISRIVLPLLRCGSWPRRTAIIFLNNTGVLALLLGLGTWPLGGPAGVVLLGLNLGIALRHLLTTTNDLNGPPAAPSPGAKRRTAIGVALNLLEVPAIVVTLGLTLGLRTVPLAVIQAWEVFALAVVPALLIAAGGEALWMGANGAQFPHPDVPAAKRDK